MTTSPMTGATDRAAAADGGRRAVAEWYGIGAPDDGGHDAQTSYDAVTAPYPLLSPVTGPDDTSAPDDLNGLYRNLNSRTDGVLGLGPEGVRFTRAKGKRLGAVAWPHDTLLVDTLHGTRIVDGEERALDGAEVRHILTAGVRQLVVVAHGDGGHLDLGELVACGLYTEVELDLATGLPLERGCRAGAACKRARRQSDVVLCSDIRAGTVYLVACKAGSLVDPAFPSTTNVAVGFLDGYAATVVAPAGNASASPAITRGLHVLARGAAPARVREYLDDVSGRGRVRYRLFGAPSASAPSAPTVTGPAADPETLSADGTTVRRSRELPPGERHFAVRVLDDVPLRPGADSVYGHRHHVLPATAPEATLRIAPDWGPRPADLDAHRADLDRMRLLYGQLSTALVAVPGHERALALGERLADLRRRHEASRFTAVRRLANGATHGLVTHPGGPEATRQLLGAWAGTVAETLELLLDRADPGDLLTSAMWRERERTGHEGCEVCGQRLHVTDYRDLLGGSGYQRHDCPHCGNRRLTPDTGRSCVTFRLVPGPRPALEVNPETEHGRCHVVWKAAFKNSAVSHPPRRAELGSTPERLPLPVPDDLTDQMHTLKAAVVSGSEVWVWRTRWRVR
ncbi:hypothetical protein ACFQVC_09750 [Streptomyces monticola]|uniref:Uncharacterized protein n=1 Tax=Streptomyces monticola TaxID=2666263 RepID=A0ABW2JEN4_9ACTN